MKNQIAIAVAIAVLVGGLFFVSPATPTRTAAPFLEYAQSVTGTGLNDATGAPAAWTVIALSRDYKKHQEQLNLLDEFASEDSLIELRKNTEVRTMVEGDPLLSKGGPLDGITDFPCVAVINTQGKLLFKRSGRNCETVAGEIADENINAKIAKPLYSEDAQHRNALARDAKAAYDYANQCPTCPNAGPKRRCPSCPLVVVNPKHPKPDEPDVDRPETPAIPDTPKLSDTPKEEEKDNFVMIAVLVGCVAGVIAYFRS